MAVLKAALYGAGWVTRLNGTRFITAHKRARLKALRVDTQRHAATGADPQRPRTEMPVS